MPDKELDPEVQVKQIPTVPSVLGPGGVSRELKPSEEKELEKRKQWSREFEREWETKEKGKTEVRMPTGDVGAKILYREIVNQVNADQRAYKAKWKKEKPKIQNIDLLPGMQDVISDPKLTYVEKLSTLRQITESYKASGLKTKFSEDEIESIGSYLNQQQKYQERLKKEAEKLAEVKDILRGPAERYCGRIEGSQAPFKFTEFYNDVLATVEKAEVNPDSKESIVNILKNINIRVTDENTDAKEALSEGAGIGSLCQYLYYASNKFKETIEDVIREENRPFWEEPGFSWRKRPIGGEATSGKEFIEYQTKRFFGKDGLNSELWNSLPRDERNYLQKLLASFYLGLSGLKSKEETPTLDDVNKKLISSGMRALAEPINESINFLIESSEDFIKTKSRSVEQLAKHFQGDKYIDELRKLVPSWIESQAKEIIETNFLQEDVYLQLIKNTIAKGYFGSNLTKGFRDEIDESVLEIQNKIEKTFGTYLVDPKLLEEFISDEAMKLTREHSLPKEDEQKFKAALTARFYKYFGTTTPKVSNLEDQPPIETFEEFPESVSIEREDIQKAVEEAAKAMRTIYENVTKLKEKVPTTTLNKTKWLMYLESEAGKIIDKFNINIGKLRDIKSAIMKKYWKLYPKVSMYAPGLATQPTWEIESPGNSYDNINPATQAETLLKPPAYSESTRPSIFKMLEKVKNRKDSFLVKAENAPASHLPSTTWKTPSELPGGISGDKTLDMNRDDDLTQKDVHPFPKRPKFEDSTLPTIMKMLTKVRSK